ncbi:MAG: hypothetical protein A2X05_05440 [Bacteroidetes bacterium GWE2_41_25]|nr:MAG: hypothetical protein A2X03_19010 [Bacteroidetes bacterium GWA2_40_15]OFX91666.1 MAG: hypothetical protein A2X06_10000 [Bacteroidetes bacterium GWC2_40_22]OFY10141.1 MAG: hypothetical protein A2X05_05440 [Bacteroidetes bacterium GWE2_41_25]OFY58451.1 MAG: hypothetical protein A2X04_13460 [Bacteroidetes bacterium GWF2_41_9]HAM11014.1 hypothetical protein [Bacteroidales bacterium]
MNFILKILNKILIVLILQLFCLPQSIIAQDTLSVEKSSGRGRKELKKDDTLFSDSLVVTNPSKSKKKEKTTVVDISNDSLPVPVNLKPIRKGDPMKATMISAVFPGGGQLFNRKYWKMPIVYAGFGALFYAISSNSDNYQMYYKGYMDFTDDIKETNSYLEFVPPKGDPSSYDPVLAPGTYNPANEALVKEKMLRLIDYHKRYRDLSIILTGVWYLAQLLDANVDASLMEYDVSDNLELTFFPSRITLPGRSSTAGINLQLTMAF